MCPFETELNFVHSCHKNLLILLNTTSPPALQGATCLKKSQMPPGFGPMMLGGDPCFMNSGRRVTKSFNNENS
jgi:hypothetical protein